MTNLELSALALAAEVEAFLKYGNHLTLALALNNFKIEQVNSDIQLGADLERMYEQSRNCPIIKIAEDRKLKIVKSEP